MPNLENLNTLQEFTQKENVRLVAVSKTKTVEDILEVYTAGQRDFGENKAQELINKAPQLPDDIQWHFIGHLQSNKVKFVVPHANWIHSVDRPKIARTISKEAQKAGKIVNCLLQIHIADEENKFGFEFKKLHAWLTLNEFKELEGINWCGVMGMATLTDDMQKVKNEFQTLSKYFSTLKKDFFSENNDFKEISMGMTGDYKEAVECGSTMVRIGSLIFGERNS